MNAADETHVRPGPLSGLHVVELGGIGPVPLCGMILSDLGAEVVRIDRPSLAGTESLAPVLHRGRRSVTIDLKAPEGRDLALRLIDLAQALVEGFRPSVTERLGLGPGACLARNPQLVYGRMTGWGQDGPLAGEAGHDIDYIALAGALGAIGPRDGNPVVPLNLVGDMGGGGMMLALGICAGVLHARATGEGQVVDAAMTDGVALQLAGIHGLLARGLWSDRRGENLLDGSAPFYGTYRCADGGHVAVGCLEPEFYAAFLARPRTCRRPAVRAISTIGRRGPRWPSGWRRRSPSGPATSGRRSSRAATPASRRCWGSPRRRVIRHNATRGTYVVDDAGAIQPGVAPRFLGTPSPAPRPAQAVGADTEDVLAELGVDNAAFARLRELGVVA